MSITDRTKHFEGIDTAGPPNEVPNTVSRHISVPERSFVGIVAEAGKPVLDAELNLYQDIASWQDRERKKWQVQSGWLRGLNRADGYEDFTFVAAGGVVDDSAGGTLIDAGTLINAIIMGRREACVAGHQVVVEYTNTQTPDANLIELEAPTVFDGTALTFKRTDFLFLEVWQSLLAHGVHATGEIIVGDYSAIVAGDKVTIGGLDLTAVVGAPGVDEFEIGTDNADTATNIAAAINDSGNSFTATVTASAILDTVTVRAVPAGTAGNAITLTVTVTTIGSISVSGATLSGGEDRPNKPSQTEIYRHGNVLSPAPVWLDDQINDPTLNFETSQRVQIQYRIRATGSAEGVNYKVNPDGFSSSSTITAQGGLSAPLAGYPFIPADNASTLLSSDATAYGVVDSGLWIAGDGSEVAAQALGALDGFVYAIPIGFVFRHNDVSDGAAAVLGFDPINNTNGAPMHDHGGYVGVIDTIAAGLSDRPDGQFADVIARENFLDLRRHVVLTAPDLKSELTYQMQSLLDGTLETWAIDTASKQTMGTGSGDVSTRFLVCDEVGRTAAKLGVAPAAGSTGRGEDIRNFDHICRRFADQSVVERVVFSFYPGDRTGGAVLPGTDNLGKYVVKAGPSPAQWYEGDVLTIDLTAFDSSLLGTVFQGLDGGGITGAPGHPDPSVANMAPPGTVFTDILSIYHDDGDYNSLVDQTVKPTLIQGLGTTLLEITLDANDIVVTGGVPPGSLFRMVGSGGLGNGSPRRIFVEVEITYPIGEGITNTPDHPVTPDATVYAGGATGVGPGSLIENDVTERPADFEAIEAPQFRSGFREVHLEYVANDTIAHGAPAPGIPVGQVNTESIVSRNTTDLVFPRRVYDPGAGPLSGATSVFDFPGAAAKTVDTTATEFGSSSRFVTLSGAPLSGAGHTLCNIEYYAQDPVPNYGASGYQVAVYYRSNAPQTAGVKDGVIDTSGDGPMPETLNVEPLCIGENVWTGQVGMGSVDQSYPYSAPLDQIPINDGAAPSTEEWYFTATAHTTVDDFDASTGLLSLHTFVPADGQNVFQFGGPAVGQPPRKDAEFRAYYPFADDTTYRPTVMSQPMFGAVRHKVFVPMLCRATEDVPNVSGGLLYRKDELLLVVLTRFAELDDENTVRFIDPAVDNRTGAAVYRTRNLLMVVGG
jgi:hypothetical protein